MYELFLTYRDGGGWWAEVYALGVAVPCFSAFAGTREAALEMARAWARERGAELIER